MDLRDYYKIILFLLLGFGSTLAQTTEVRCINPKFDNKVERYIDDNVPVISVADAFESKDKFTFLDAREYEEYEVSHIEDAIYIGYKKFDIDKVKNTVPKDAKIVIYCSIGYRSGKIGKKLLQHGYMNVSNLYGSIFEWVNQHHPVFDLKGEKTDKVHTYSKKWGRWVENDSVEKVW